MRIHRIGSIDIWNAVAYSRTLNNYNHIVITLFYYPDWVVGIRR